MYAVAERIMLIHVKKNILLLVLEIVIYILST